MAPDPANGGTVYAAELEIRLGEGLVLARGRALTLSVREFELLAALSRRLGAIITRDELFAAVWGRHLRPGDRAVDVYVSKLRAKLEAALPDRRFIHTHPGFGYRFQPESSRGGPVAENSARTRGARRRTTRGARIHRMFTWPLQQADKTLGEKIARPAALTRSGRGSSVKPPEETQ